YADQILALAGKCTAQAPDPVVSGPCPSASKSSPAAADSPEKAQSQT
ncbi:MAG: hypothetical protein GKC10_05800, partial [Methanosarcinales archaeon]|nr:hypothetical protein [Methanosarcinales archaeon]